MPYDLWPATDRDLVVQARQSLQADLDEMRAIYTGLDEEGRHRPWAPGEWSPAQILDHLNQVNAPYSGHVVSLASQAQAGGDAPVSWGLGMKFFLKVAGSRSRLPAPKIVHPPARPDAEAVWTEFERITASAIDSMAGLELKAVSRVQGRHPMLSILPFSLSDAVHMLGMHTRYHADQFRHLAGRSSG
ncbi:MAG: DinB family protein [Fimbriimonadaceae bacterium]|nr:DinB family protein [Fimbriimonadaceae bacterium]